MAHLWFYTQADQKVGPVPEAELKRLGASGTLSATDLVWRDGMPEWRAAGSLKGLMARQPTGGPPPVPSGPSRQTLVTAGAMVDQLAERVGFLDIRFRQFATPHLIGIVFGMGLLVILGSFAYWTDYALSTFVAKKAAFAIVLLVITHGFLAVGMRVVLELCVVVFRIAEHLSHLRHLAKEDNASPNA